TAPKRALNRRLGAVVEHLSVAADADLDATRPLSILEREAMRIMFFLSRARPASPVRHRGSRPAWVERQALPPRREIDLPRLPNARSQRDPPRLPNASSPRSRTGPGRMQP